MGRTHAIAAVIENAASQQCLRLYSGDGMIGYLLTQLGLDGLKEFLIENGRRSPGNVSPLKLTSPI